MIGCLQPSTWIIEDLYRNKAQLEFYVGGYIVVVEGYIVEPYLLPLIAVEPIITLL